MRRWYAMDVQFLTDPKVEALGEKHGPVGPLTIVSLFSAAKVQGASGTVRNTYRITAASVFDEPATVKAIIEDAAESGLLEAGNIGERGFEVRLPAWFNWQEAHRKREGRAKTSDNVRERPPTGTGTVTNNTSRKGEDERRPTPEEAPLSHLLASLMVQNGCRPPRVSPEWARQERLLIERDEISPREAESVLRWVQADDFEKSNVLSMPKFRKRYDQLRLKWKRDQGTGWDDGFGGKA